MKYLLSLIATGLMFTQTLNAQEACVTLYNSDANYIMTALNLEEVTDAYTVENLNWNRLTSTRGRLDVTLDGTAKSIEINQTCGGKLEAKFITKNNPDKPVDSDYYCKEWVNCMPTIGGPSEGGFCTEDYFKWAEDNCEVQPKKAY